MTEAEIRNALAQRLDQIGYAVAWENSDTLPTKPYVAFQVVRVDRETPAIGGGQTLSRGYMFATVVTDVGGHDTQALTMADAILAAFPKALRLGGLVVEKSTALIGFRDGPDWRLPVRADYVAQTAADGAVTIPSLPALADLLSGDAGNELEIGSDGKIFMNDDDQPVHIDLGTFN